MEPILIAGAGPTGLSAALLLTDHGLPVRIIDKADNLSNQSKALALNPRTLSLLESTGVTEELIDGGWRVQRMNVWRGARLAIQMRMGEVKHRYNFMLVHPQSDSERVLANALARRGVEIEHDVELIDVRLGEKEIVVELDRGGGEIESMTCGYLLGADGAHSTVRKRLDIGFPGEAYPEHWKLYDVELEFPLENDQGHVFLLDDGVLFMLRLRDNLWRLAGNVPDLIDRLPAGTSIGPVHWESVFRISNRVAEKVQIGPICLAGDAAHIHSPLGARGMNLGVEDAYVFASLAAEGRLEEYEQRRLKIMRSVVRWVSRTTEIPRGKTLAGIFVRRFPGLAGSIASLTAGSARKWIMGLDHEV